MRSIVAMQYMKGFSCLGGACVDECCSKTFKIPYDRTDFEVLQSRAAGSEEMRSEVARGFDMDVGGNFFAFTKMNDKGSCCFLTPEKLCLIHANLGEDALGSVCRTFPRVINVLGDRAEVSGAIGCEEVARKLFLGKEPTRFVPVAREELPAGRLHIEKEIAPEDVPFADFLRECFIRILFHSGYPLPARLYFLLLFVEKSISVAGAESPDARIINGRKSFDRFVDPENLNKHGAIIRLIKTDAVWPRDLMTAIIKDKLSASVNEPFRRWLEGLGLFNSPDLFHEPVGDLAPRLGGTLDSLLLTYLCNKFISKPVEKPEAVSDFIQVSLVSQMLLRFILVSSSINRRASLGIEDILKAVSAYSRFFEHDLNYERRIKKYLSGFQVNSMAHWITMLKCLV